MTEIFQENPFVCYMAEIFSGYEGIVGIWSAPMLACGRLEELVHGLLLVHFLEDGGSFENANAESDPGAKIEDSQNKNDACMLDTTFCAACAGLRAV